MKTLLSMAAILVLMGNAVDSMARDFVGEGDCEEGGGQTTYDHNRNIPICKGGQYNGIRLATDEEIQSQEFTDQETREMEEQERDNMIGKKQCPGSAYSDISC